MEKLYSVLVSAMTDSGVAFVAIMNGVRAESEPEARVKAMTHGMQHGLNIVLKNGDDPIPAKPIIIVPLDVQEKIEVTSNMPPAKGGLIL